MARYRMIALANPGAGMEAEYNDWQQNTHMPEVLELKGMRAAQRWKVVESLYPDNPSQYRYLSVYEIETDDIEGTMAALKEAGPGLTPTDARDTEGKPYVYVFEEVAERIESKPAKAVG